MFGRATITSTFLVMVFIMAAHSNGQTILFYPCNFFFFSSSSFVFFLSSILSGRRLDVYRISTYGVALVRI